ncbi:MAG: hypothetical protein Q8N60_04020 [Candidatus Diapherotrites archaeon]|nr:hypothetical protein [Candidatus Diapherotrites archaeon]
MNRKGAYSGIIASIAIVVIIAVAFNSSAAVKAQTEKDYAKAIIDVKSDWQNARYLLDKSTSDAIADDGFAVGCNYDRASIENKLRGPSGYFQLTLNESLTNCKVENISVTGNNPNNIQIQTDLSCSKSIITEYKRTAITFLKVASYDGSGINCKVDVADKRSGICEVDTIDTGVTGKGCGS